MYLSFIEWYKYKTTDHKESRVSLTPCSPTTLSRSCSSEICCFRALVMDSFSWICICSSFWSWSIRWSLLAISFCITFTYNQLLEYPSIQKTGLLYVFLELIKIEVHFNTKNIWWMLLKYVSKLAYLHVHTNFS